MQSLVAALVTAAFVALGSAAYRHPKEFRSNWPWMFGVMIAVTASIYGYAGGAMVTESVTVSAVGMADPDALKRVHEAALSVQMPTWGYWAPGLVFAYMSVLLGLPRMGFVSKE